MASVAQIQRVWLATAPNRFGIERPPLWWLSEIADYDAELVIFPSQVGPMYRVARRRYYTAGHLSLSGDVNAHPDSTLMDANGLVPVISFAHTGGAVWTSGSLLDWLKSQDIWAQGGGDKAADAVEQAEATAEQKLKAGIKADMDYRSRDAWRSYNARAGSRNKSARDGARHAYGRKGQRITSRPFAGTGMFAADTGPVCM